MKHLIFTVLDIMGKIGESLFNMATILRYIPDPYKVDLDFNSAEVKMETANYVTDALLEPATYIIHCLIRLADGSIHPGTSTIRHIDSENNEVVTSYIFSPNGNVPLQTYDEENDKLIIHEHKVLIDLNSEEFPTPFKNIILRQDIDNYRIIIDSVPASLITPDSHDPLTMDEQALLPYNFNYYYPRINGSEYVIRVSKAEGTEYESKFGESLILYKFANGIQTVGTVFTTFNPCLPFCFTILHNRVMTLLTDSNYRELLDVENLEELCPFKTFDIKYNEETEKAELREIFEIEKEDFLELLNFDSTEFE